MVPRDELICELNRFLEIEDVQDYGPNGLQVEGREKVDRVVTAVTASEAAILAAASRGADMLVVHHGLFWHQQSPVLRGSMLKRVRALLEAGITLLAYHLPLDRHPLVGNNAPALRELGVHELQPFAPARGIHLGWQGLFPEPVSPSELVRRLEALFQVRPMAFLHGPAEIASVGMVSGAAQSEIHTAVLQGLHAFITGEVSEYNYHLAKEEGIHHLSLGHHASERTGPRHLADYLSRTFPLEAEFVDIPNPV